jgi:hypothetical protein
MSFNKLAQAGNEEREQCGNSVCFSVAHRPAFLIFFLFYYIGDHGYKYLLAAPEILMIFNGFKELAVIP